MLQTLSTRCTFTLLAVVVFLSFGVAAVADDSPEITATALRSASTVNVMVQLVDEPTAVVFAKRLQEASAAKLGDGDAKLAAGRAARLHFARVEEAQTRVLPALTGKGVGGKVMFRVQRAFNGIALTVDPAKLDAIRRMPGVRSVVEMVPEYPTNSTSVSFLGTPTVWGNTIGLAAGADGTGVRIGVIDTGIDYIHSAFGGTGLLTDYQANNGTVAPDAYFPSAKVVGGVDLAGDAYTGSNAPVPDSDPMDCNGHGSHVSGTAAGLGVNADGTTYAGPWNETTNFAAMRIGPGTAPKALLYGIRVFGCSGSTNLTTQGIDWSLDPNGDNDLSDHLDVINMSLGSNFGRADSSSAIAATNAALAGVIVVASAGNAGDTFFISGSPGAGAGVLAVAASSDSGLSAAVVTVNSPAGIAGSYAALPGAFTPAPPTPSGQTASVVLADDGVAPTADGCTAPFVNAAAISGNIAFIDRGVCGFITKVANAQAAGAIGVIIANNVAGDPSLTSMGGSGFTITIPSVFVNTADGALIKASLGSGVNATLRSVAAGDELASFSSRGPRGGSPVVLKPDVTAPGVSITSVQTGNTSTGFVPGNQTLTISGTSMASPHVAGIMALLRQLHPDWSVEQLKALAMNGALHDVFLGANGGLPRYSPGRAGAGRIDPPKSALLETTVFNAQEPLLVSISFDVPTVGTGSAIRNARVINSGTSSVTFDVAVSVLNDAPGVSFAPGSASITVAPGQSVELPVTMSWNANQMDHFRETSLAPTQAAPAGSLAGLGSIARHWLTEESGYLVFSTGGVAKMRLPLYAAVRPDSAMAAAGVVATGGAGSGSTTLALSGTDVCSGTLGVGPTCTGIFPNDEVSLVTPFELQVVSPRDTAVPAYSDLQYGGIAWTGTQFLFGVSTFEDWSPSNDTTFNIYVDTNLDGTWDRILFDADTGYASRLFSGSASAQDTYLNYVFNLGTNGISVSGTNFVNRVSPATLDTALHMSNVKFLSATPSQLGYAAAASYAIRYKIVTCPGYAPLCVLQLGGFFDEAAGPYNWNTAAQGFNFSGSNLAQDLNGATLPLAWNSANLTTNASLGGLLLHHHNTPGNRAQVVLIDTAASADLAITKGVAGTIEVGSNVTFTITVTNNGPDAASGIVVTDILPPGLTYVSDNGAGAYSSATGLWTVGALNAAASATLQIVATIETSAPIVNIAAITSSTPLDLVSTNNQASATVDAPNSSDLSLTKVAGAATASSGAAISFTVTLSNAGPDAAYDVVVTDVFSGYAGVTASSFTASAGSFNTGTGIWNVPGLAAGASATLVLNLTAPLTAGTLTNTATITSSDSIDPVPTNNSAAASITVSALADLSLTLTCPASVVKGKNMKCTYAITNDGPSAATNVLFADTLPAFSIFVGSSPACTLESGWILTCNAGTIGSGATSNGSITIRRGGTGSIVQNATVTATEFDPNLANNTVTATTTVTP